MLKPKQLGDRQKGMTSAKQRQSIVEQMGDLEVQVNAAFARINQSFQQIQQSLEGLTRVVNALVVNVGKDAVNATVQQQRIDEIEAEAAAVAASIEAAVTRGALKAAEVVEDDTAIVVTSQFNKDGTQLHPLRMAVPLDGYKPEVRELLKGKRINDELLLEDGSKVVVQAVYVPSNATEAAPPQEVGDNSLPPEATSANPEATGA